MVFVHAHVHCRSTCRPKFKQEFKIYTGNWNVLSFVRKVNKKLCTTCVYSHVGVPGLDTNGSQLATD